MTSSLLSDWKDYEWQGISFTYEYNFNFCLNCIFTWILFIFFFLRYSLVEKWIFLMREKKTQKIVQSWESMKRKLFLDYGKNFLKSPDPA